MHHGPFARVALLASPDDPCSAWFHEAAEQAGVWHEALTLADLGRLGDFDVLLLGGQCRFEASDARAVADWASRGGAVVSSGSTFGLDELFGVVSTGEPAWSRGRAVGSAEAGTLWPESAPWIRFFGGRRVAARSAEVLARADTGEPLLLRRGRATLLVADLGRTLSTMAMGRAVGSDGVGPGDGTAHLEDGVLRAEDGTALDFATDRESPHCPPPAFALAHADALREVWVRCVVTACRQVGKSPLILWPWPENAPAAATLSVDCPDMDLGAVTEIVSCLARFGSPSAFLVPSPGLPADAYRQLRKAGHEPAVLITGRHPSGDDVRVQHRSVVRMAGLANLPTTRLVDGGWHGYTEPYLAAVASQAWLSAAKGGRQPGTSGFLFGTASLFHAHAFGGERLPVVELPYLAFEPGVVTPVSVLAPIAEQVVAYGGCFHVAASTPGWSHPKAEQGLHALQVIWRQARLARLSPGEIHRREVARRSVRIEAGADWLHVSSPDELHGLTLLMGGEGWSLDVPGKRYQPGAVARYGTRLTACVIDLEAKARREVRFTPSQSAA
jgi:hypothetical protein